MLQKIQTQVIYFLSTLAYRSDVFVQGILPSLAPLDSGVNEYMYLVGQSPMRRNGCWLHALREVEMTHKRACPVIRGSGGGLSEGWGLL